MTPYKRQVLGADRARPDGTVSPRLELSLLMPAYVAMYSVFNGMQNVLLPQQAQTLGRNVINALAALAAGRALMAAIANPLAGTLSDRTHSRFGRRAPWLLACSILAALGLLLLLAGQNSFFLLGAVYLFVMLSGFRNVWHHGSSRPASSGRSRLRGVRGLPPAVPWVAHFRASSHM